MIIEWECILECNYKCFYCSNGRNDMLKSPISYEKNKERVFGFLCDLRTMYPDDELFVFGGEPFLHPFIDEIIHHMNDIGLKYVIQTNFSMVDKMKEILLNEKYHIQVSLHPSEIKDIIQLMVDVKDLQHIIRRVDVMYIGQQSLKLYNDIKQVLGNGILYLAPVADFNMNDGVCNHHLYDFNEMKKSVNRVVYNFEKGGRSFNWEEQMKNKISYKNKVCIYKDRYILFDPSLNQFTCNYRQNNEICPNDQCFLM